MKKHESGCFLMKTARAAVAAGAVLLLSAPPVFAQTVQISGQPCPLPVEAETGEVNEVLLTTFVVYGVVDDKAAVRYQEPQVPAEAAVDASSADAAISAVDASSADAAISAVDASVADTAADAAVAAAAAVPGAWQAGYVARADMESLLPLLDLDALPDGSGMERLFRGSKGDMAALLQANLIQLGYLTGTADGAYGPGTADAVLRFQTDHQLEATGSADVYTQLAAISAAEGKLDEVIALKYPAELTVEQKFGSILDKVDVDLSAFTGAEWRFTYDKFAGSGVIDPGLALGSVSVDGADIDRISVNASLKVIVADNGESGLDVIPAVVVETCGAYRPYVQSVSLSGNGTLCELAGAVTAGEVDGTQLIEKAYIPLTGEALSLLGSGERVGIRINGRSRQYDLTMTAEAGQLAAFSAAAGRLM